MKRTKKLKHSLIVGWAIVLESTTEYDNAAFFCLQYDEKKTEENKKMKICHSSLKLVSLSSMHVSFGANRKKLLKFIHEFIMNVLPTSRRFMFSIWCFFTLTLQTYNYFSICSSNCLLNQKKSNESHFL